MPKSKNPKKTTRTTPYDLRPPPTSPNPPQRTTLFTLPPELFSQILSYLPRASAPALALCCRQSYHKLGHHYTSLLNPRVKYNLRLPAAHTQLQAQVRAKAHADSAPRYEFLQLLEHNRPDVVFCFECQMLHSPHGDYRRKMCEKWEKGHVERKWRRPFYWVYWALRRVREGVPFEVAFGDGDVPRVCTKFDKRNNVLSQRRVVIKMIDDRLYRRTQHWLFTTMEPSDKRLYDYDFEPCIQFHDDPKMMCCPLSFGRWLQGRWHSRVDYPYAQQVGRTSAVTCNACLEEWQADVKLFHESSSTLSPLRAYVVTRWEDFGEVRSPFDEAWSKHFQSRGRDLIARPRERVKRTFDGEAFDFEDGMPEESLKELVAEWEEIEKRGDGTSKFPKEYLL